MDFQIGCCYWFISRGQGRVLKVNKENNQVIEVEENEL